MNEANCEAQFAGDLGFDVRLDQRRQRAGQRQSALEGLPGDDLEVRGHEFENLRLPAPRGSFVLVATKGD